MSDAIVRIPAVEGEFAWHDHDEDKLSSAWRASSGSRLRDHEPIEFVARDVFVVPQGIEHRPVAERPHSCF